MAQNEKELELLRIAVKKHFASVLYPGSDNLVLCGCEECQGVKKTFTDVEWQTIDCELLEDNYDQLPAFSPAAFHYFIPAYLFHSLDNFGRHGVCEYTVYALTPGKEYKDKAKSAWWRERLAPFTQEQMNVIYEFLHMAKQEPSFDGYITSIDSGIERLKLLRSQN